ncbi:MAG: efflux RND transporter periplasmic adaptor subunit [Thermodesulfobacteriota bacterium]
MNIAPILCAAALLILSPGVSSAATDDHDHQTPAARQEKHDHHDPAGENGHGSGEAHADGHDQAAAGDAGEHPDADHAAGHGREPSPPHPGAGHADAQHAGHDDDDEHEGHEGHADEADLVEMTKEQQREIGLEIRSAAPGIVGGELEFVGEIRLHEDRLVHIVPRVGGIALSVAVSLGEQVREGQTLALIDSPELAELKADYLERSRAVELTRRTLERKQYLRQEKIASEADWQEAEAAFQNAETLLLTAKRRLAALGLGQKEIAGLAGAGDGDFSHYRLRAPISGTVIARHISRGEKIGEEEVFTVADLSVVWVDLQVPARDLGRIREGFHVVITSTEGMTAEGKLTTIGPVVDPESRTALARVELDNPQGLWKPGIFVKGEIHADTDPVAVVVPAAAVQNIEGGDVVFVPAGHGFRPVAVSLGKAGGNEVEILSGLMPGDPYVARGAFELKAVKVTSGAGSHAGHGH